LFVKKLCKNATRPIRKKTLMNQKNLTTQMNNSANCLTIKDLPAEMVELSDEALSQVWGGVYVRPSDLIFNGMVKLGGGGAGTGGDDTCDNHTSSDAIDSVILPGV
jgi:hypothetical protein